MRIAIVNLTGGGLSGGYLKYLRKLLPLLLADPRVEGLDVFVPPGVLGEARLDSIPLRTWPRSDPLWGFRRLKRHLQALNPDVVFVPTARWLDCGRIPVVTMVRNMEPLEVPFAGNTIAAGLKNAARALEARRACGRAARVIAVSNHVRHFLTKRWRVSPVKVGVVYHGVERAAECGPPTMPSVLRGRAPAPFIFAAGSIRPARGLEDVIEALGRLGDVRPRPSLVIAGDVPAEARSYRQRLARRASELGVAERIVWTGLLTAREMWWCFDACSAFVMTSRVEACPNIALEAMSRGCLCVSVDHAPMPEFFGGAAVYYRAGAVEDLARRLSPVTSGEGRPSADLRPVAVSRAAEFTWEATADRTITELRTVVSG